MKMCLFFFAPALALAGPFAKTALEFGGDSLVDASYTDGTRSSIPAGRGLLLAGGYSAPFSGNFGARATLGVKWSSVRPAANGSADWIRWPADLLFYYQSEEFRLRLGAGVTYQFGNQIHGSGAGEAVAQKFRDALGFLAEGEAMLGEERRFGLGLRYTAIRYRPVASASFAEGNSLGLSASYEWH